MYNFFNLKRIKLIYKPFSISLYRQRGRMVKSFLINGKRERHDCILKSTRDSVVSFEKTIYSKVDNLQQGSHFVLLAIFAHSHSTRGIFAHLHFTRTRKFFK